MILDGSYVGVIMRVAEYTVDCAVALGAPLGFGRATTLHITYPGSNLFLLFLPHVCQLHAAEILGFLVMEYGIPITGV